MASLPLYWDIRSGKLQLIWSYVLDYENSKNPYQDRKDRIKTWKNYAAWDIEETAGILEKTELLNQKGFRKIDSLHIACAIIAKCEYFRTTDDEILKLANIVADININDPIGFIKEVVL